VQDDDGGFLRYAVGQYYAVTPCTKPTLGAVPASQATGGGVTFSASTTGCPNPRYRFWIQGPKGAWAIKQDYGTSNTYNWSIAGLSLGNYGLEVDVRDLGATDTYEKVNSLTDVIGTAPCITPTLGASPTSPGATGATITFTATTSGCTN